MRNAVRLAKEKSRTAYREVRSKFKDMQIHKELEGAAYSHSTGNTKLRDKPRSAPSSPKLSSSEMSASHRRTAVSPSTLARQLNSNFLDRNHSLRRCETSVSQHYHVSGNSPGFPAETNGESSSTDGSDTEDELNMTPLNLNLMDDMKDILARTAASVSTPPAVDRSVNNFSYLLTGVLFVSISACGCGVKGFQFYLVYTFCFDCFLLFMLQRKPSLSSPPISPVANPVLRQHSAPVLNTGPYSVQPLPLPPIRCRKRNDAQKKSPTSKVI